MEGASTKQAPIIVGIYGIPGSGKSHLLKELQLQFYHQPFLFFEGSRVIDDLIDGGLPRFMKLPDDEKSMWRRKAIESIRESCANSGKVGVVAGHLMFWTEGDAAGKSVYTPEDLKHYTHILYLEVDADLIVQRRLGDKEKTRPPTSVHHLREWQRTEIAVLSEICPNHDILLYRLSTQDQLRSQPLASILRDFGYHSEAYNLKCAEAQLDKLIRAQPGGSMLVFDGDRTLAEEDTGEMFWSTSSQGEIGARRLRSLFSSPMGYTYRAFRQAMLMYEEVASEEDFDSICTAVASAVTVHPDLVLLLRKATSQRRVDALVMTCGLRRVWEKVIGRIGLAGLVRVIGSGRVSDGFVVTPAVKAALVCRMKDVYHKHVWAFGDGPLDLPMLAKADHAIIVVGKEDKRSKSMDSLLLRAIEHDGLKARQLLLPKDAPPRLNVTKLPIIPINDLKFADFTHGGPLKETYPGSLMHATDRSAAKILMTPTRDAGIKGPALRKAHHRIGQYLAIEFLPQVVGLEEYEISHVQGHGTSGFRLCKQSQTLIAALMRGGEPMAFGVHGVMPDAAFFHGEEYNDELEKLLNGRRCVILVDSVVNSGTTIAEFAKPIRKQYPEMLIVVIAGVVQEQCLSHGVVVDMLVSDDKFRVIALRLSRNKFAGKRDTDTGNRLFNTV
ncbi:uracil phosphoribosyltransferase-domain-containing protein [Xylaria sp. CBS 124048]|nr:uracil phosphoribosyltransferase-domain-containing protein [Xylaria sp. CBS 124048]